MNDVRLSSWGHNLEPTICEQCDWQFLIPAGVLPHHCPHCYTGELAVLDEVPKDGPMSHTPELYLPFILTADHIDRAIQTFAEGIWFAPTDLTLQNLQSRLSKIYLPMWLVDSDVVATWQAEAGYNYETVTHQDRFDDKTGGWVSHQLTDTRIRWEPRVGRLRRHYDNIVAPALEEHRHLNQQLGPYDLRKSESYQPQASTDSYIRLPNRSESDAWPEAIPELHVQASEECRRACEANVLREFRWKADFQNQHWTLLLQPLYTTYYLDDEQTPHPILIHGQTGRLVGHRRASLQHAQKATITIEIIAVVIFIISGLLGLVSLAFPPLLLISIIGLIIALIIGGGGLFPLIVVWQFNRQK